MDTTYEDCIFNDLAYLVCSKLSEPDDDVISDQIRLEISRTALAGVMIKNAKLAAAFSTLPLQLFVNIIRREAEHQLSVPRIDALGPPSPIRGVTRNDAEMIGQIVRRALLRLDVLK